ncbi:MAG: hypothetical protein ACREX4_21050 [Gammaproteobacteria bacterium]
MPEATLFLTELEMRDDFMRRHIGPDRTQCAQMRRSSVCAVSRI